MSEKEPVIEIKNVWKRYGLPLVPFVKKQFHRLQGRPIHNEDYGPWALRELNLTIKQGESLGVIGRNGAGKSTLLKLLAGVSPVTYGDLVTNGRIFPMIELNAGLNTELTGYENIEILGAIMGLRGAALQEKLPYMAEFSELGDKLENPVRTYSSGMMARLGFSVAINVNADILLLDEVLSVGDVSFQKKCLQRMEKLISDGKTVLFVSHSPYAIERICDRAIFLEDGKIMIDGKTSEVTTAYFQNVLIGDKQTRLQTPQSESVNTGSGVTIDKVTVHNPETDKEITETNVGEPFIVRTWLTIDEPIERANVSLRVTDTASTVIASLFQPSYDLNASGFIDCYVENCTMMPDVYYISCIIKAGTGTLLSSLNQGASLIVNVTPDVHNQTGSIGQIYVPTTWKYSAYEH